MIVKVQVPQFASGPGGRIDPDAADILIYDMTGRHRWMLPPAKFDAETLARIRKDCAARGKAYYQATVIGNSFRRLGKRVEEQPW
jgi:hypothetical protein